MPAMPPSPSPLLLLLLRAPLRRVPVHSTAAAAAATRCHGHGVTASALRYRNARAPAARVFCSATPKPSGTSSAKPKQMSLAMGLAAGGFAGVLSALSGVGGGMVLIPAVARMTSMPMQTVNGTCLGGLTAGAGVGAWNYAQADACNYPLALLTSIPAIAFARVGVRAAHRLSSRALSSLVGAGMLASVPLIALKDTVLLARLQTMLWQQLHVSERVASITSGEGSASTDSSASNPLDLQHFHTHHRTPAAPGVIDLQLADAIAADPRAFAAANARYAAVGAFAGFVSGLCGIGGTMVTTTYLTAGTDMPQSVVVGTTLMSVLPMALSANYYNYKGGAIHVPTALRIGGALVAGVYCTSSLLLQAQVIPEGFLRAVLATTIAVASVAMIRRPV